MSARIVPAMGVPEDVRRIADAWWARDFACAPGELRPRTTRVQAHAGELAGNAGIWILVAGASPLVSMPPELLPELHERAMRWTVATIEDPAQLAASIAPRGGIEIIGPAYIGYATTQSLEHLGSGSARELHGADESAVAALRAQCSAEEWEHGGSEFEKVPTFGAFDAGGTLAALAGYERWRDSIAHISIVTRRDRRGQGHGAAAVALAAEHASSKGLLPQYRTLKANRPSMQIAEKLGFEPYGCSVYVKFSERVRT
jgi:GNAT superfamily N-acetyltransferase